MPKHTRKNTRDRNKDKKRGRVVPNSAGPVPPRTKRPEPAKRTIGTKPRYGDDKYVICSLIKSKGRLVLKPVSRQDKREWKMRDADKTAFNLDEGVVVRCELKRDGKTGVTFPFILSVLGTRDDAGLYSHIAALARDIPDIFTPAALKESEDASVPPLGNRTDLRAIPLITIDGADARDFDDAVFAEPDPAAPDGWHLVVAIADVAHYVRPHSALDKSALLRGNSVYFADRVIPMLPENLSNNLCSLRPHEPRACLAVHIWIDANGDITRYQFIRGLMQSVARLTYNQVQAAHDGQLDDTTRPIADSLIKPLYGAYQCLKRARNRRGTLDLDVPEKYVVLNTKGRVDSVSIRPRFDSHMLIEEMMIAANVAAGVELDKQKQAALYRIHPAPDAARIETLRSTFELLGMKLPGIVNNKTLAAALDSIRDHKNAPLLHKMLLRLQAQAVYSPSNVGHFGLALSHYTHFTSPIRRYADLIVHRALIRCLNLGDDGLTDYELGRLHDTADAISSTERRAIDAERETIDRYMAHFLSARINEILPGRISGASPFGLYVTLDDIGGDGFVPIGTLGGDRYHYDPDHLSLIGSRSRTTYRLMQPVMVRVVESNPMTCSIVFHLVHTAPAGGAPKTLAKTARRR